ncbi:hypothetical protein Tco_1060729 [Tanacetum coccineum]
MFHKKNIDYVYLLWEDLLFQIENKDAKTTNKMSYPRLTNIIIDYFMSKDQSISRRNKMFWHTARDDTMFTSMRCISRHKDTQTYYAFAPGEKDLKPKYIRKKANSDTSPKKKPIQASKGDGVDTQSKVPDEQQQKVTGTNEGAGVIPEVPDVPKYDSESKEESWTFSQDDEDAEEESDKNDDKDQEEEKADEEEEEEEKIDDEEVSSDQKVSTPPDYELTKEEENKEDEDKDKEGEHEEEEEEEEDELYRDLNINLERSDAEMTDAQANQDTKDTHVTLTNVPLVSDTLVNVPVSVAAETPSSVTIIPQLPIPNIQPLQQTPTSTTTTTTNPIMTLPEIHNFASLFQFDQRVSTLESEMSEFRQTSQFSEVVSSIPGIVDTYLASKIKEAVDVVVQLQTNKLREEAQEDNQEFLNQVDSTMKAIIKEQVQAQVSKIMPNIKKYITESLEAEVLVRSTNQPQTSYAVAALLSEFKLKKILIDKMETNKSIDMSNTQKNLYNALVESYNTDKDIITSDGDVVTLKKGRDDQDKDEDPSAGSNRWSKRRRSGKEVESSKEPKNKESKSTSSSKSASKSQPKSLGKSAHAEEHDQKAADLEDQPHQEFNTGNDNLSPEREALNEDVWQRNPSRPPTPDREWHKTKTVDNRPPQP